MDVMDIQLSNWKLRTLVGAEYKRRSYSCCGCGKMSMVEYMCKLFYGRRGIQLTEEQYQAIVGRNARNSQLRVEWFTLIHNVFLRFLNSFSLLHQNVFSDLNNKECLRNDESLIPLNRVMHGWPAFNSEEWTKLSPQCTTLNKNYFSPLQLSTFSLPFSNAAGSNNKYCSSDTIPSDFHEINAHSHSSFSFPQYLSSFQEFPSSTYDPSHSIRCYISNDTAPSTNNFGFSSFYQGVDSSCLGEGNHQKPLDGQTLSTSNFRTSSDDNRSSLSSEKSPPVTVHFTFSSDASLWCNPKFSKTKYFNEDANSTDIKNQIFFGEASYHKIPCKVFSSDQLVTDDGLYGCQVMSPTVDSTVNSIESRLDIVFLLFKA